MARFRQIHYGVVVEYIIQPSQTLNGDQSETTNTDVSNTQDENVKGTGGTDLVTFLTKVRQAVPKAKFT